MDANSDMRSSTAELKPGEESRTVEGVAPEGADPRLGTLVRGFTSEAERLLTALDANGDGKVSAQELHDGRRRDIVEVAGDGAAPTAAEGARAPAARLSRLVQSFTVQADRLLESFDEDHDGKLSSEEFKLGIATGAIEVGDTSACGAGAVVEVQNVGLRTLVRGFTAEAARLMQALDTSQDGHVAVGEFRAGLKADILELGAQERFARQLRGFTVEANEYLHALPRNKDGAVSPDERKQSVDAGSVKASPHRDGAFGDPSVHTLVRRLTTEAFQLLRALDANGDGGVAVGECRDGARADKAEVSDVGVGSARGAGANEQALSTYVRGLTAEAARLLKELDADADDRVSAAELKRGEKAGVLEVDNGDGKSYELPLPTLVRGFTLEAQRLLEALDANGDGVVAAGEFKGGARAGIVEAVASASKSGSMDGVTSQTTSTRETGTATAEDAPGPKPAPKKVLRKSKTTVIERVWTDSDEKALKDSVAKIFEIFDNDTDGILKIDDLKRAVKAGVLRPASAAPGNEPTVPADALTRPRPSTRKTGKGKSGERRTIKVRIDTVPRPS